MRRRATRSAAPRAPARAAAPARPTAHVPPAAAARPTTCVQAALERATRPRVGGAEVVASSGHARRLLARVSPPPARPRGKPLGTPFVRGQSYVRARYESLRRSPPLAGAQTPRRPNSCPRARPTVRPPRHHQHGSYRWKLAGGCSRLPTTDQDRSRVEDNPARSRPRPRRNCLLEYNSPSLTLPSPFPSPRAARRPRPATLQCAPCPRVPPARLLPSPSPLPARAHRAPRRTRARAARRARNVDAFGS